MKKEAKPTQTFSSGRAEEMLSDFANGRPK